MARDNKADVVHLKGTVSAAEIETYARDLSEHRVITVDQIGDTHLGADGLLLQWMIQQRSQGGHTLRLPAPERPGEPWDPRNTNLLTSRLYGLIASRTAASVVTPDGRDISAETFALQVGAKIPDRGALDPDEYTATFLFDDAFPGLGRNAEFDPAQVDFAGSVHGKLITQLRRIHLLESSGSVPDAAALESLTRFLVEALDNTNKHAREDLSKRRIGGLRFLTIRRRLMADMPRPTSGADRGPKSLASYLGALDQKLDGRRPPLVEFTVADSGIGIAAHHSKDADVYNGPIDDELAVLRSAFANAGDPTATWDGFGLYKMQYAAHALRAFLMVRSGRLLATQHYLDQEPPTRQVGDSAVYDYSLSIAHPPRARVAGTSVTVVVPWTSAFSTATLF